MNRPELSPALVGMLAGGPKHAGPKAIRGHRTSIEAFDILRRKLVRAGLLLPTPSWLLVRILPVAVVVLCVVGLIDGGDSNSSDYEDVRLEHPSVPLNADPNR